MRVEYVLLTARGATIRTFAERKAAMEFARLNAETFPGCELFEFTHQEPIRRRIWRERAPLRLVTA